jgi:penicillin amidase
VVDWTIPFIIGRPESPWWDDVGTRKRRETREDILAAAWLTAITTLEQELGSDLSAWRWETLHTVEHVHPLGREEPLNLIFNVGPFPVTGAREVIDNQIFSFSTGPKRVRSGPSTKRIIDFSDPEYSLGIIPSGQSGFVFDDHYDDQAELFHTGQLRPQFMSREEILAQADGTLNLVP